MIYISLLAIQGMNTSEEIGAWLFIVFVSIIGFYQIFIVVTYHVEQRDDRIFDHVKKQKPVKIGRLKAKEYAFDYSMRKNVRLFYYGENVLYATIVSEKVHFFFSHNNKTAAPFLQYNPERMKAVETVLMTAHKKLLKALNKRTTGKIDEWDVINPQHEMRSIKSKRLDIEIV